MMSKNSEFFGLGYLHTPSSEDCKAIVLNDALHISSRTGNETLTACVDKAAHKLTRSLRPDFEADLETATERTSIEGLRKEGAVGMAKPCFMSAKEMMEGDHPVLSSGCDVLDECLGGGIRTGWICEVCAFVCKYGW